MVLGLAAQRPQPAKTKGLRVFFFFLINPGKILCKLNCHQSFTFHHLETRGRPLTSLAFGICEPEHPLCVHGAVVPWPRGRISDSLRGPLISGSSRYQCVYFSVAGTSRDFLPFIFLVSLEFSSVTAHNSFTCLASEHAPW